MKIRTQFIISMAVFGALLLAISASVVATNREVARLNGQLEIANRIERDASELSYLWNDYLLYRESQLRTRWESKFAAFSTDVASLAPEAPEQRALVDNIKASQRRLQAVFADVASALEGTSRSRDDAIAQAFIEDSWSRMAVQNQGIFFDASRLSRMLREQVDQSRQRKLQLIFALLVMFGAYFLTNYLLIYRRTLGTLSDLKAGTRIVGSGNLDFAIAVKRHDEIGELSDAFNQMTTSLKAVTASKAALERETAERKRAEAERERLLASEQEARKLAEAAVKVRDEFSAVAAHELKTPVTSLSGYAQLITRQFDRTGTVDAERLAKALRQIVLQSGKLTQLTEQLLDLSRLETGRLVLTRQEVNLTSLARGAIDTVQHAHPERVLDLVDGVPLVAYVDPLRIEQVITNLLDNAVKFSPGGSPGVVEVAADGDGWAEIAVRDYGMGIPREKW